MNSRQTILTSANRKKKLIYQTDLEDANSLANHAPGKEMLYTLEEIAILTEDLMSLDAPTDVNGRILEVRPKGHWFEYEVAKRLGYNYPPGGGLFPDIRHQIVLTGAQIIKVFGVSPTATIKYQMGISGKWRESHCGKMLVGEKIWLTA